MDGLLHLLSKVGAICLYTTYLFALRLPVDTETSVSSLVTMCCRIILLRGRDPRTSLVFAFIVSKDIEPANGKRP